MAMMCVVDGEKYFIGFVDTDGGRHQSKRPKQKNDCTIRAIAITTGVDYDVIYDRLKKLGRNCNGKTPSKVSKDYMTKYVAHRYHSFPAVKDEPRMNVMTFCRQYNKGRFIVRIAKHHFALVDGVIHDDGPIVDDGFKCVYGAYEII